MKIKYFVSYYYKNFFFDKGFGWVELIHEREINGGDDIHEITRLIKSYTGFKKVSIINFNIISKEFDLETAPFWRVYDRA